MVISDAFGMFPSTNSAICETFERYCSQISYDQEDRLVCWVGRIDAQESERGSVLDWRDDACELQMLSPISPTRLRETSCGWDLVIASSAGIIAGRIARHPV